MAKNPEKKTAWICRLDQYPPNDTKTKNRKSEKRTKGETFSIVNITKSSTQLSSQLFSCL